MIYNDTYIYIYIYIYNITPSHMFHVCFDVFHGLWAQIWCQVGGGCDALEAAFSGVAEARSAADRVPWNFNGNFNGN